MCDQLYFAPTNRDELLCDLGKLTEHSKIIGGGTDLILQLYSGECMPDALLYPGLLTEAKGITEDNNEIRIGAMTDMTTIASSAVLNTSAMALVQAAAHVGSTQIRNKATIGGNVANASPAGDLLVPLWLFGARALIAGPNGERSVTMDELVTGIGKTSLAYNEVLIAFVFEKPKQGVKTAYKKLGSRSEVTISRVGLAALIETENGVVSRAELMLGAVAPTPVRAKIAECELIGYALEPQSIAKAGEALARYILDINNRPNRFYKSHAAKGVLEDVIVLL